jgi:hypothetical protein
MIRMVISFVSAAGLADPVIWRSGKSNRLYFRGRNACCCQVSGGVVALIARQFEARLPAKHCLLPKCSVTIAHLSGQKKGRQYAPFSQSSLTVNDGGGAIP